MSDREMINSDTPLITIGITAFNASATIRKAIGSALAQTWKNKEIVIVDDCSTDNTVGIIRELESQNSIIRSFLNPVNGGVAVTRNRIIQEARGSFIAFFDDDDFSEPARVKKQYERIIKYEKDFSVKDPIVCYTGRIQHYPKGNERYEGTLGNNDQIEAPYGIDVVKKILFGFPAVGRGSCATCSQMARKNLYEQLKFDANLRRSEDTDFNIRAALIGAHFVGIKEPLVHQTMTLTFDKKLEDEKSYNLQYLLKYRDLIDQYYSYEFCKKWIEMKFDFLQRRKITFIFKMILLLLQFPYKTIQKLLWALPNIGFNLNFKNFYKS